MILFHRSAAAPWGYMASFIKKSPTADSLFWFQSHKVPHQVLFVAPLDGICILVPSTTRDPSATNARAKLKGTGHTQLSSSRHFICKPTTLLTLPSTQPYQTHFIYLYLQPYNIHNKANHILHLERFLELSFVNTYNLLFIPFGVISSLLLLLYINFVASISRLSSFLQKRSPSLYCWFEYGLFFYKM